MNRSSAKFKSHYDINDEIPLPVNFYAKLPSLEITLREFEAFAFDRFCLLQEIERGCMQFGDADERKNYIDSMAKKYMPLDSNKLGNVDSRQLQDQRRKDFLSHYILRLAFCQNESRCKWFIDQEVELFKARYSRLDAEEKERFTNQLKLPFSVASKADLAVVPEYYVQNVAGPVLIKTRFEQVLDLVAKRQVFLYEGTAFVAVKYLSELLVNAFRESLRDGMKSLIQVLPQMSLEEDDRLVSILRYFATARSVSSQSFDESNAAIEGGVTSGMVESLTKHFPLCMKELHRSMVKNRHLSHMGRIQYGLFLKGIGMPIEESLIFWRQAFSKLSDDEYKKKNYAYYIRYNYGLEGRKTSFSPFSCFKIITSNHPGPNDNHGCPYKHYSPQILRNRLQGEGLDDFQINEILNMCGTQHYERACTRVFELTKGKLAHWNADPEAMDAFDDQPSRLTETITHPNQYFELAYRLEHPAEGDNAKPIFVKKSERAIISEVKI